MKCVLLLSPGEILEGEQELKAMGYEAETYPSTQQTDQLTDTVDEELAPFFIRTIESYDSPYVRSLRSSFSRMITDPRFLDDDFIIFGESDCTPVTPADEIKKALEKAMREYPDTDVFRLFHKSFHTSVPSPVKNEEIFLFEPLDTRNRTRGTSYVWGTHALIIPAKSREKVAKVFASYRLPIDNALEAAHSRGDLKITITKDTHFYQKKRTCFFDKTQSYSYRNRKIAVCLSSQGNPEELQRLLYSMMEQSYSDFHVFAAVKGIPESQFLAMIEPSFRKYTESGKLTLRCFPVKGAPSDFLDSIRDQNLDDYELFVRITENTFYPPDYLQNVNLFHCEIPQHRSSFYEGPVSVYSQEKSSTPPEQKKREIFAGSFVFTPAIMKQIQAVESDSVSLPPSTQKEHPAPLDQNETDSLLLRFMKKEGCSSIDEFIKKNNLLPHLSATLPLSKTFFHAAP